MPTPGPAGPARVATVAGAAERVQASFERSEPVPGIRLISERMPYVRSAAVGVWVDVGSRDEPAPLGGSSHLLEHLLFKGTERRSARDIAEEFDAVGGEINAYSSKEHTCYYARVLDTDVALAIDVAADMIENAVLRPDDLEAERSVVLEELRMNADVPDDRVHDLWVEAAWPSHPLGRPVIGTEASVAAIDRDSLHAFYTSGYVPGRLVVALAGNVEHREAAELVAASFGRRGERVPRRADDPPRDLVPSATYEPSDTEQVHVVWGGPGLTRNDPDRYALGVLNALYGSGMSSRLFQEVRENRALVYSIYTYQHTYADAGLFAVSAGTSASKIDEVLRIVRAEAGELASGAISEAEVARAKGHVRGGLVLSMEDPGGRMSRLGRAELGDEEIPRIDELLDRVDAVAVDDVVRVARRVFGGPGFVLAAIGDIPLGALDFSVEAL